MLRQLVFFLVTLVISALLYVFPAVYYLNYLNIYIDRWHQLFILVATASCIQLYLQTKITFRPLKWFVFFGMAAGFYGLLFSLGFMILEQFMVVPVLYLMPFCLVFLLVYGAWNARFIRFVNLNFRSDKVTVSHRFAFISDVHIGSQPVSYLNRILAEIKQHNVAGILIGGDLIDNSAIDIQELSQFKDSDVPVFFVTGNHEYYLQNAQAKIAELAEVGIDVIYNDVRQFGELQLIGLSDAQLPATQLATLDKLALTDAYSILLVHKPQLWPMVAGTVDLSLSGHTHAGQMLPFHWLVQLQFKFYYGLYQHLNSFCYVSSGVGCWGPRIRIGSSNEIVILEITPE